MVLPLSQKNFTEIAQKTIATVVAPTFTTISKSIQEGTWIMPHGKIAVNSFLSENVEKSQKLFETIKPFSELLLGNILYKNEMHSLLNSFPKNDFSKINNNLRRGNIEKNESEEDNSIKKL